MKRTLSFLLALFLLVTSLPMNAFTVLAEELTAEETSPLAGKTISILGASISTYAGTSNGAAAETTNSTIAGNVKYYPNSTIPEVTLEDTWWMQTAEDLGLRLLVNNAWSGSAILPERSGTVGAYVDRCVQLHDDTGENAGEEPDIICIQMGFNDFSYGKDTLGNAEIDYDTLITADGYGTPSTTMEATAIMLHKMTKRYPNAEIYMFNHFKRIGQSASDTALMEELNASIETVCARYGVKIVDLYSNLTQAEHIGDGKLHPNRLGMDVITEAVKTAILENTKYTASCHTVSMALENVTADYGTDKLVMDGDGFALNLNSPDDLQVTVTMGGKDVTASVYADGAISIPAVTGDVKITAKGVHLPKHYRWEFDGTDLVAAIGDNTLTKTAGTTAEGVFSNTTYDLESPIVLRHDLPWQVEWKCQGTWKNSESSSGGRLFTSTPVNAEYNARYLFKSATKWLIAMGEKTTTGSHNYGIALEDHGIDGSALHTYRLENRVAADGSNMVYLFVDGEEIGAMNHYYVGTTDKKTTSNWLSGKDFTLPYFGTDTHGLTNCSIEYIEVWECDHSYTATVTPPTLTAQGYTTYTCTACGDSYVSDYTDKLENLWSGRSAVFVGDSITAGVGTTKLYYQFLEEALDFSSVTAMGVGGSCFSAASDYGQKNQPLINRYQSIPTADLIVIFMGTNDYGHETPLGTLSDTGDGTFYGALNTIIPALVQKHTSSKIVFVTSLHRYGLGTSGILGTAFTYDHIPNGVGATLGDYVNALRTVCANNGVAVIDLYTECTLDPTDAEVRTTYMPDGLHPNAAGHEVIAGIMESHILGYTPVAEEPISVPEMIQGNKFASGNTQPCRASSYANYYLKAGTVITLKNPDVMQWACAKTSGEYTTDNLGYFPEKQWTDITTAVVDEDGWIGFTFKYRDETQAFDLTRPLSDFITIHTHVYTATVTPPTCTEKGYTTYACECGDSYVGDYVDADGEHDFTEWYTTKEATYNADGEESRDCQKCSHVEFRSVKLEVITSGNVGKGTPYTDDVTYTLYADGTMVISGKGIVYCSDWRGDYQPYKDYRAQIKTLIVEDGITTTAGGCFAHFYNLETVSLPDSLTKIGNNAFMSSFSGSVTDIVIPKTITYIGAYSYGFYYGKGGTTFTDIIIENPDVQIVDNKAVFNAGNNLENLTLYSYGNSNNISAYAEKYGCKYVDLETYKTGVYSGVEYMYYDGVLTFSAAQNDATIAGEDAPWNAVKNNVQKIVIESGITGIAANAFKDYYNLESVETNNGIHYVGDNAFATAEPCDHTLTLALPRTVKSIGSGLFAGRQNVTLTAYLGSAAAEINSPGVKLDLKKQFKLLLIGNSYSEDASGCGQGMTDSQLLSILQAMLGEDAEITVALLSSGGKGMHWHATQAEQGNKAYSFRVITTTNPTWKSLGSYTSTDALAWTDWDAVSLQPYNINVSTGRESVPYPDSTDPKFYHIEDSSAYMLDHVARYAPYADIYFYMHWAQTSGTVLNAALSNYNKAAAFMPTVLNYVGTESGARFKTLIPVGLSVQNARTTYLALLAYNTTAYADGNLNLVTDAQIGLQRDGGHVSFNIGRYIAGLTFAEMIIPPEMRAPGYVLPDIRVTESIGVLPKEYTEIAQKAVWAAVESWKQGSLAVTEISGYTEDPAITAKKELEAQTLQMGCQASNEALKIAISSLIAETLGADFAVKSVTLPEGFTLTGKEQTFTATVSVRFGYTTVTVTVVGSIAAHSHISTITPPTCTEQGYTTYTCECGESYAADEVAATGHSYTSIVTQPTATTQGYTTYTCEVCGDSYVADYTDFTGFDSYEDAVKYLREQMVARVPSVTVRLYGVQLDENQVYNFRNDAWAHTGVPYEGDYIRQNCLATSCSSVTGTDDKGIYTEMYFNTTWFTTAAQEAEVDAAVADLLAEWNLENATDYQKIKCAYDWVCTNVVYDHDNLYDSTYLLKHSSYAALIHGKAVCQGFATLFYRLCLELGVDCRVITGQTDESHAWNIVKLGDKYYNMDPTYDRGTGNYYRYFLTTIYSFGGHDRNAEYETDAFNAAYPMATLPYVEKVAASGTLSNGMEWILDGDTGVLTVTGNGAIPDYRQWNAPWEPYSDSILGIELSEGITQVGDRAFAWCKNATYLSLPSTLKVICEYGFNNCRSLTEIDLPDGLTTLEFCAFSECSGLQSVYVSANLTSIGSSVFSNCPNIATIEFGEGFTHIADSMFSNTAVKELILPDTIVSIGSSAFARCEKLTYVRIPASVTYISHSAFINCSKLRQIGVVSDNPNYLSSFGVLFTKDAKTLVCFPAGMIPDRGTYTVPTGVTTIGDSSFYGASHVTRLVIPDSVTLIDDYAFAFCDGLYSVDIGANVTRLGDTAFGFCTALTSITFANPKMEIDNYCFTHCTKLKSFTFPAEIPALSPGILTDCHAITEIEIPKNVSVIESGCFQFMKSLKKVTIPANITKLENCAFFNCTALEEVVIEGDLSFIDWSAFDTCSNLKFVHFKGRVSSFATTTDRELFRDCPVLFAVYFDDLATAKKVTSATAFGNLCKNALTVAVPAGSTGLSSFITTNYPIRSTIFKDGVAYDLYSKHTCSWSTTGSAVTVGCERRTPQYCTICRGKKDAITYVHSYTTTYDPPSCTEEGKYTYTCTVCGYSFEEMIPAEGHYYDYVITDPTCTEEGRYDYFCFYCDHTYTEPIPPLGHSFEAWYTVKEATCTTAGERQRDCLNCGLSEIETIPAFGHDLAVYQAKDPTCTEIGWKAYESCLLCDYTTYAEVPALGHSYTAVVTKPTCTEQGFTTYTCHCGDSYVDDYVDVRPLNILMIGNSFSWDAADAGYGLQQSQMYDTILSMLKDGCSVKLGVVVRGSTKLSYHYAHREDATDYKYTEINPQSGMWEPSTPPANTCIAEALQREEWDIIVLQPYREEMTGGNDVTTSLVNLLDYFAEQEPTAKVYYYMPWAATDQSAGNTPAKYQDIAAFTVQNIPGLAGILSANKFAGIIPVGTGIENARGTYLGNLTYGSGNGGARPDLDIQVGLERDNQHVSFGIGRYIAGVIFAETLIPLEMRKADYTLPSIKNSAAIGVLPPEYTTIAQKAIANALENPFEITALPGYETDPAGIAQEAFENLNLTFAGIATEEELKNALLEAANSVLSREGFAAPVVTLTDSTFSVDGTLLGYHGTVTFRFGYTTCIATTKKHPYTAIITPPTCTEEGYTTYTCHCGDSYVADKVPATGHSFGQWETVEEATCTENGEQRRDCANCDHYETKSIAATGHTYIAAVTKPTCTTEGYTTYTCHCGDSYVADKTPATGHSFGDWYTTKEAGCTENGLEQRDCKNCNHFETKGINATGHSYTSVVTKPTCTTEGYTTYTCHCGDSYVADKTPATGHSFGQWYTVKEATCTADGEQRRDCENCDHYETKVINATGHSYKATVTKPTCTEGGFTTYTCHCGDSYVADRTPATGHTFGQWYTLKDPTCTENGLERRDCENCDHYETQAIPATGHSYQATITKPTCTEDGYTTYICHCGDSYVADKVPALGHSFGQWETVKEATCTADGEQRRDCANCDRFETKVIEATGHSYTSVVTKPTCTEDGYTTYTCHCGDSYVADKIPATGHTFGQWYTTKEATCTADGEQRRDCASCDHYETKGINATGHSYTSVVTKPTCTTEGYTTYTCHCGDSYVADKIPATGHTFGQWYTLKEATCTENGEQRRDCENCDHYETKGIYATGHSYTSVVTKPTCTTEGFTTYTCHCGDSYVADKTPATGHSFGQWETTREATCTADGEQRRACANCDACETKVITATGHSYTAVVTKPTCTTEGYTTYTCHCGDSYVADKIPATGHSFGQWETVKEATCTADGEQRRECENCNHFETKVIEATGHSYTSVVTKPTCTEGGYTTYTCKCEDSYVADRTPATGHSYTSVVTKPTCTEGGYTTYTCATCGDSYVADHTNAIGHIWDSGVVTVEPTEETTGIKIFTCTLCGEINTVTLPTLEHTHKYEGVVTKPTCTTEGYTTYTCRCGDYYVADKTPATGHTFGQWYTLKDPTCTENGLDRRDCENCDHYETKGINATGHSYKATITKPTCTEEGFTTYTCHCGDSYVADRTPATGHTYGDWETVKEATCTADGEQRRDCANCEHYETKVIEATGHSYQATVTKPTCTEDGYTTYTCHCGDSYVADKIPATGHTFGQWYTTKEATCTADGEQRRDCASCDHYKTQAIPATGHSYTAVVTKPTCTTEGYTTYTCHCGDSYVTDKIPATGHTFGQWETVKEATCTAEGEQRRDCASCDHYETQAIPATGHSYESVVTEPTCTEKGYTTYTCHCGDSYVDNYVDAAGHSFGQWYTLKDPTCTENGLERKDCENCDRYETKVIEATGHSYTSVVTKPTCTEEGYTTYTCHCGDSYVADRTPATGHSYESVLTRPTCTEKGYYTYTCHCGDYYVGNHIPATGHAWDDGVVTVEPTEETTGTKIFTCTVCGEINTVTLPTLEHIHKYEGVVTKPTCTTEGYTTYTCRCGDSYVADRTPALGHSYNAVVTEPTCTEQGYTTYTCTVCGDSYVSDYVDPAGHAWGEWQDVAPGKEERSCTACGETETRDKLPDYDVDGNGTIDQADVELLMSILVGNTQTETLYDFDFDGKLTIYDCVLLTQQIA